MIIAITGGSGFIGKLLVNRHIEQGDQGERNWLSSSSEI